MNHHFDITLVGGGIAGLACAALLSQGEHAAKLRLTVVDAGAQPEFSSTDDIGLRVSAIANGSAEQLASVGAWQRVLQGRVSPYDVMRVWDERDEPESTTALSFDAAEFALPQLGFIVENSLVQHALLGVLSDRDVDIQYSTRIDSLPQADLVIGADGARSIVRELAGIKTKAWPYRQTAVVTHLETEIAHDGRALQRFLRTGPLGMLPLADGRISVVWSTTPEAAELALQSTDAKLGEMLSEASDRVLGQLRVSGPRGAFPLRAHHAENYVQPGLALIGDAAHAIHPLAGQGANLGLQDGAVLARVVSEAISSGLHPGDKPVLRRYERERKGANLTMLHFMTGLNRLFTTDSAVLEELRLTGMRLFNRSGPVREHAVRVALGVK